MDKLIAVQKIKGISFNMRFEIIRLKVSTTSALILASCGVYAESRRLLPIVTSFSPGWGRGTLSNRKNKDAPMQIAVITK
jgi:hypothetical protein